MVDGANGAGVWRAASGGFGPHPPQVAVAANAADGPRSQFDRAVQAHLRHYLRRVEDEGRWLGGDPERAGARQLEAVKALGAERDNLILALETALAAKEDMPAAQLTEGLHRLLGLRSEMQLLHKQAEMVLTASPPQTRGMLRLQGVLAAAHCLLRMGNPRAAKDFVEEAIELADELGLTNEQALARIYCGRMRHSHGDDDQATVQYSDAFAIASQYQHHHSAAVAATLLGSLAFARGDLSLARKWYEAAYEAQRAAGHVQASIESACNLALLEGRVGNIEKAQSTYELALRNVRALGNPYTEAQILHHLAIVAQDRKELDAAIKLSEQALVILAQLGEVRLRATILENIAMISCETQRISHALPLLREARRLRKNVLPETSSSAGLLFEAIVRILQRKSQRAILPLRRALRLIRIQPEPKLAAMAVGTAGAVLADSPRSRSGAAFLEAAIVLNGEEDLDIKPLVMDMFCSKLEKLHKLEPSPSREPVARDSIDALLRSAYSQLTEVARESRLEKVV